MDRLHGGGFGAQSWQPNTDWLAWRGTAAGGGYSTAAPSRDSPTRSPAPVAQPRLHGDAHHRQGGPGSGSDRLRFRRLSRQARERLVGTGRRARDERRPEGSRSPVTWSWCWRTSIRRRHSGSRNTSTRGFRPRKGPTYSMSPRRRRARVPRRPRATAAALPRAPRHPGDASTGSRAQLCTHLPTGARPVLGLDGTGEGGCQPRVSTGYCVFHE